MPWKRNLVGHDKGIARSIGGAADEQMFFSKATKAGFYVSVKLWRDAPYDAVLDYKGDLYRVEVKGTNSGRVDLTRGGRSGKQISRNADNKQRPLTKKDCDFAVGVYGDGADNVCYIIPIEVIEILSGRRTIGAFGLSRSYLEKYFKERWDLLTGGRLNLRADEVKAGFLAVSPEVRQQYLRRLGVSLPVPPVYNVSNSRTKVYDTSDIETLLIWQEFGT